jgi:hypothetical protein
VKERLFEGWARGGRGALKMKKNHDGLKVAGKLFLVSYFFGSLYMGFFFHGPLFTTKRQGKGGRGGGGREEGRETHPMQPPGG